MTLFSYQAALLRNHPRIQSGERLNVGVVVFTPDTRLLAFRLLRSRRRVVDAFPGRDSSAFPRQLRGIARTLTGLGAPGALDEDFTVLEVDPRVEGLGELLPNLGPAFSWSEVRFGVGASIERILGDVYEENVGRYETGETRERVTPRALWTTAADSEPMRQILPRLRSGYTLSTKATDHKFRAGWKNGVTHVADAISLDYTRPQKTVSQAEVWSGRLHELGRDHDFRFVGVISSEPEEPKLAEAYRSAVDILQGNPWVRGLFEVSEVSRLAGLIRADLEAH